MSFISESCMYAAVSVPDVLLLPKKPAEQTNPDLLWPT